MRWIDVVFENPAVGKFKRARFGESLGSSEGSYRFYKEEVEYDGLLGSKLTRTQFGFVNAWGMTIHKGELLANYNN